MHLPANLSALPQHNTVNRILWSAVLCLLPSALTAQIQSLTHYSDLIEVEASEAYSSDHAVVPGWSFFEGSVEDPIPKFDPSFGILEKINISVNVRLEVSAELQAWNVMDETEPHSAGFDTFTHPFFAGLYYTPTPGTSLDIFFEAEVNVDLFLERDATSDDSESQTSDVFGMLYQEVVTVYDPANEVDLVNLDDFVGAGSIVGLRPGMFVPLSGNFLLDNVESADVWADAQFYDSWIEVEYVYQIPESRYVGPGVALAAAALALLRLRRRARSVVA
ncbi:MAG: hypothetical protein JJU00_09540 [Opitutales bacterium]|nr:hypothetical protein [Opitutales bacterium]